MLSSLKLIPVNINYGSDKCWTWGKWTWSPGTGLSATTGTSIIITPGAIGGTITYTIQHTFDEVFDPNVTPTAFDHSTLASQTANKDGNYAFPVSGVRITVTAGGGSVSMNVIQAGI